MIDLESILEFEPDPITDASSIPPVSSLKKLEPVPDKFYFTINLLVGPHTGWMKATGSREWAEKDSGVMGDKSKRTYPIMRKWIVKNVPGSVVNGLIQRGNDWLGANLVQSPEDGWLNRLMFVISTERQVNYEPKFADFSTGSLSMDLINNAIENRVNAALARMAAGDQTVPGQTSSGTRSKS